MQTEITRMKHLINNTLAIELIAEKHLDQLITLVSNNRLYLREWLTWVDDLKSSEDFKRFITHSEEQNKNGSHYSCVIIENEQVIGRIGLYRIDQLNRIASIGYWVGELWEGKGIVSKACEAILQHGFETLQLNRIEIHCATGNSKSLSIPKRLGFQREGIMRQAELLNGQFVDHYCYSMLHEEWLESYSKSKK